MYTIACYCTVYILWLSPCLYTHLFGKTYFNFFIKNKLGFTFTILFYQSDFFLCFFLCKYCLLFLFFSFFLFF